MLILASAYSRVSDPWAQATTFADLPVLTQARILVIDEWLVATAVQHTLEAAGHLVTDAASNIDEALSSVEREVPDLAVVGIHLADGGDGIGLAHELRSRFDVPVLYLTADPDEQTLARAASTQPAGIVVKPFLKAQFLSAVTIALNNSAASRMQSGDGSAVPSGGDGRVPDAAQDRGNKFRSVARALAARPVTDFDKQRVLQGVLTPRELEVVRLLLAAGRVASIANHLGVSPFTVRNQLRGIFRKLGVHSQVELIQRLKQQMS